MSVAWEWLHKRTATDPVSCEWRLEEIKTRQDWSRDRAWLCWQQGFFFTCVADADANRKCVKRSLSWLTLMVKVQQGMRKHASRNTHKHTDAQLISSCRRPSQKFHKAPTVHLQRGDSLETQIRDVFTWCSWFLQEDREEKVKRVIRKEFSSHTRWGLNPEVEGFNQRWGETRTVARRTRRKTDSAFHLDQLFWCLHH